MKIIQIVDMYRTSKLIKNLILISFALFLAIFFNIESKASGRSVHNTDILFVFFGVEDDAGLSEEEKITYSIISDAVYYAIDENGQHAKTAYPAFVKNVAKKNSQIARKLPSANEFPSLGGGNHRAYCHQGFNYHYNREDEQKYNERWEWGRDNILIPAVAAAYDLNINDKNDMAKAEILSIIAYYSHIIGDINVGNTSQMKNVSSYKKMLDTMRSDITEAVNNCSDSYCKGYQMEKVTNLKNHDSVRDYMRSNFEELIDELTGRKKDQTIFEKATSWIKKIA